MHPFDHVFLLVLVVAQPVLAAVSYRRYLHRIELGQPANQIAVYRETLVIEWLAFAVLITAWYFFGRPISDLGFVVPGGMRFYIGIILVAALCGFFAYQLRVASRMAVDQKAKQIEALGDLVHLLPRSQREYRYFLGLSLTAGIVEEVIYRGFAIWYLAHFIPLWGAVVVSSMIFGLGHSYQGVAGMARTGLVGFGSGVLYVFTGSIWLSIIGHALMDILQGRTFFEIYRDHKQGEAHA